MAEHRTVMVAASVTPAEHSAWPDRAAAAGVSPSALLRQAMARTRNVDRAGTGHRARAQPHIARIGNNLNQLARWANTHASAVAVIANLVSLERSLLAVARLDGDGSDAH